MQYTRVSQAVLSIGLASVACRETSDSSLRAVEESRTTGTSASALVDSNYTRDLDPDIGGPERGVAYWYGSSPIDPYTVSNLFLWLGNECDVDLYWQSPTDASPVLEEWASRALNLRAQGRKAIFRPRYDRDGAGGVVNRCGKFEADSYARMQNHVRAIARMLADPAIKPTVAFIEMGYLGSWGEWNASGDIDPITSGEQDCGTNWQVCDDYSPVLLAGFDGSAPAQDRVTFAKYVIDTYRSHGITRPVGLRRPQFHNDIRHYQQVPAAYMGFYNDCFMHSAYDPEDNGSDGGTFIKPESSYNAPNVPTPRYSLTVLTPQSAAKAYMRQMVQQSTQGGESCRRSSTSHEWYALPANVPGRMDLDGFHYFKPGTRDASDFRGRMIATSDAVYGSVWNAIKSQLGYRFHALRTNYPSSIASGASMTLAVDIENGGFARFPNERRAYFVLRGATASYVVGPQNPKPDSYQLIAIPSSAESSPGAHSWNSTSTTFSQTFAAPPPGTYSVHLYVPDPDCIPGSAQCDDTVKANYAVRLATRRSNQPLFQAALGTNDLGVSVSVGPATGCAGGGNLIQNCGFDSDTTSWSCSHGGGATGSCSVVAGELQEIITNPGTAAYHVQPNQRNLALVNGRTYSVSFDARASVARPITVSVTMNHDSYKSYSGVRSVNLTTSMASYGFTFTMTDPSDMNVKFEFGLGANGTNTVYLDNVVLR